jgi:hypothetical protein
MRIQNEFTLAAPLFQLAQALLPGPILQTLFGRRVMPVRVESSRAAQARQLARRFGRN